MKFIKNVKNNIPFLINLINKQNLMNTLKSCKFFFEANKYFNDLNPGRLKIKTPKE